jgi:hypothetical protein
MRDRLGAERLPVAPRWKRTHRQPAQKALVHTHRERSPSGRGSEPARVARERV